MSPIQPSRRQLLQEIRRNLGPAIGTSSLTRADRDLLYEASIWSLVWDAALTVGATCDLMDRTGVARGVVLRRAPSELSTRTANHTHVRISGSRSAVEAHQGIYLTGLSGAYHQADLAILPADETASVPLRRMRPRAGQLVFAVEAKCYGSGVGINTARSYLGLRSDFASRVALVTCAPEGNDGLLVSRHTRGIDTKFHDAAPGRSAWEELRRVIARHLRSVI